MNQALITALQTVRNERNIILMVPYMTPEDDIISALEEMITAAQESKESRAKAAAELAAQAEVQPETVSAELV